MANLPAVKKIHISTLMAWDGMNYEDALTYANSLPKDKPYTSYSVTQAKEGIEKHLLNGREIKMEYLTGQETAPEGYFQDLANQISQTMSREQIMKSVMVILKEIHDNWVANPENVKKYDRDANAEGSKKDRRLFQHLPIQMIGMEEVAKDLMFLAPILEELGINVGEMQQQAWGCFIPSDEVSSTYSIFSEESMRNKGITTENLAEKLPEIIKSYPSLQGTSEESLARKQYMLERIPLLSNQVNKCLGLDNPVA